LAVAIGATTATDVLSALLPFLLLLAFWFYIARSRRTPFRRDMDASLTKLDEIRDEIRLLRETIERQHKGSRD
jgi:hypothetical protein